MVNSQIMLSVLRYDALLVNNIIFIYIQGTCYTLEKSYFRLTSAPDPSEVRPEEVLQKALDLIIKKWKNKEVDYLYLDD